MTATQPTPTVQQALTGLGVTDDVRFFVQEVADRVLCLVGDTSSTQYVRLVGADLSQTSLYVHKGFVSIALPTDISAHWETATGAALQKKPATHYLLVRQAELDDEPSRAAALDAATFS